MRGREEARREKGKETVDTDEDKSIDARYVLAKVKKRGLPG